MINLIMGLYDHIDMNLKEINVIVQLLNWQRAIRGNEIMYMGNMGLLRTLIGNRAYVESIGNINSY